MFDTEKGYLKIHRCVEDAVCSPQNIKEEEIESEGKREEVRGGETSLFNVRLEQENAIIQRNEYLIDSGFSVNSIA